MTDTTLSLPPARPGRPPTEVSSAEPPAERPRRRAWLPAFWAVVFVAFLVRAPGRTTFETKLGVVTDPWRFIGDLGNLWHDRAGFGGIADQYIGYAFPILPYYALADLLHLPIWLAERLWLSLIVSAAFWGALRLAERLRVGSARSRLLGAVAYALWPTFTIVIGSTSAAVLPGALLPWVLLPLASTRLNPRTAAARSALLIPFMGGVNAASTLAALLPVGLYLLTRPAGPRKWALIGWWVPGVLLATAWWVVPLLLLGIYGENFLPYIEQAETTTSTMSATELLRGAGDWVAYLHFGEPWLPAGWTVATAVVTILGSAFAAALGLAGLARRDLPERRWLTLTVLVVALIALAGYGGSFGAPFHGTARDWLDGWLRPFRNIYKFEPGLALALVLGLTHLVGTAGERERVLPRPARRFAPALAALLILPGLAWPYLNGTILQPGSFEKLPDHWRQTAQWLDRHSSDTRALVVPATAHGLYTWGSPIDQPLDPLAESPWAQRDFVPFGTPGVRRATDAVEQALLTGGAVPGLRDFLSRAGLYTVVVRNDLDPDQIGYVQPATVIRTLESSGYHRVTGFGPLITGGRIPEETPVQVQGLFTRRQAVEIYEPSPDTPRPGRVGSRAVADTALLSGGPEALLQLSVDPTLRDRPTVLTGDAHPGIDRPGTRLVADGLRRADTRFGLINSNTSYPYTATERNPSDSTQNPGTPPKQILPIDGAEHQSTAELRGATSVSASSSGNWLFHLPQFDPVNAFDGDPATAWAEGSPGKPAGQWLKVGFTAPTDIPASLLLTPLAGDGLRAVPTRVRIETDRGAREGTLRPEGTAQPVPAPPGAAKWLKVTILDAQTARSGLSGAGFAEVAIPGVQVSRLLRLPADADRDDAQTSVYSLHRDIDLGGLSPVAAEDGLHRRFATPQAGDFAFDIRAVAVPGPELDRLLVAAAPEQARRITVTAESTGRTGRSLSPRNLVDGDLTTAWIAGDRPVVELSWPDRKTIDRIVFGAAGGLSSRPEEVRITAPNGSVTTTVDENGLARFGPIDTDRITITITRTAPLTVHNPLADKRLQLPVGLSEIHVPALAGLRTPPPDPKLGFTLPCGQGPALAVDGVLHTTSVAGSVRDLLERRPVSVRLCAAEAAGGALPLGPGLHTVEAGNQGPLQITDVTATRGRLPVPDRRSARSADAADWSGDHRSVRMGAGEATYLQMYENHNSGWKATLNGKELRPVRIDGWQQGWLVPAGAAGTVELDYEPGDIYRGGLIGAAVALAALLALAFVRRRKQDPTGLDEPLADPPAPGRILGVLALTVVIAVVAGPVALLVPALAVVAHLRHRLLVPIALAAMAGAGIAAAVGADEPVVGGRGAFGPAAQVLALIALCAALVTTGGGEPGGLRTAAGGGRHGRTRDAGTGAAPAGAAGTTGAAAPPGPPAPPSPDGPKAAGAGSMAESAPPDGVPVGDGTGSGRDRSDREADTAQLPSHPDREADTAQLPTLSPGGGEAGAAQAPTPPSGGNATGAAQSPAPPPDRNATDTAQSPVPPTHHLATDTTAPPDGNATGATQSPAPPTAHHATDTAPPPDGNATGATQSPAPPTAHHATDTAQAPAPPTDHHATGATQSPAPPTGGKGAGQP
ncbi:alpha-(1-_3)-arabinofuranosyltransferase family protein [Embleya sp. NPDC059267]|uniref:alpha-(1->3)-arabinofuranosyltransferase domain-containing protein n=2 Tax=Embleya TaxID=2699295 RepID=UPI00368679C8